MKTYTKLIHALLISAVTAGNAIPQWIAEKSPVSVNLNSIALSTENQGWIVGDKGTILFRNQDAWNESAKVTDEDLYSVVLTGRESGWAVGSRGTILRLNGSAWEAYPSPTSEILYSVSFRDYNHGYASGANGTLLTYSNGTWLVVNTSTRANLYSVTYLGDLCFIGGGQECRNVPLMKVDETANRKLVKVFDPDFTELKSLAISPNKNAWAVGHSGRIFYFNGNRWENAEAPDNLASLNFVGFSKEDQGIAVGYNGQILVYKGDRWEREESNIKTRLNGAAMEGATFYAIGNNGTILKSNQLNSNEIQDPVKPKMLGISPFPNPSTDFVRFTKPENTNDNEPIVMTVSNANGQVIINRSIQGLAQDQEYHFATSDLASGVYFIHLKSPSFTASGRFFVKH